MALSNKFSASRLINLYGQTVTIENGNVSASTKAFIQPLRHSDKRTISGSYTETVIDNSEQFLYIGNPDIRLDTFPLDTTSITAGTDVYILKKADKICFSDEVLYIRAILSKEVEE